MSRAMETSAERETRLENNRHFKSTSRAKETSEEREARLENDRHFKSKSRAIETAAGRKIRLEKDRLRILKRNADISTLTNTINTYCGSICEICTKRTYPNQVTTYKVSTSKASYLPAELAQNTTLLLCHRCNKHVNSSKQTPPSKAYWNSLDPGAIPEVILQLSQPEQRLLSRIIPFVKIVRYSGRFGQYGCKGQAILFAQDIFEVSDKLHNMLPRSTGNAGMTTEHLENLNITRTWNSSMCLANVYFYLSGTAKVWFENIEEQITSWELFETMLSQVFGHHASEKDQLLEKLKARAQRKGKSSEAYIQDVLYLCRQINPNMNKEKVAHLVKGVSEEIYRTIFTFEIATIEEFIRWCRKIELSQKKRTYRPRRNPPCIESQPATLKPSSLDLIIREQVERNFPFKGQCHEQYSKRPQIFKQTPRQQFLNQRPPVLNQTPLQRRTNNGRHTKTFEYVSIAVARDISPLSKPVALSWPWKIPLKTKRNAVAFSPIQSISSPPKPEKLRRSTENGADYFVISESFRLYLKIQFFAKKWPVLRVANRKHIETLGRCNLKVSIVELEIYFIFVVFSEFSHHIILGLDFFRPTCAVIDCGRGEIHLKESVNDGLEEDLPTHALEDFFVLARSIKKITAINEGIRGGKDLMIEGSKYLILKKKELVVPSSIISFRDGRGEIWVTNGTSQNQIIPAGMLIGYLRNIGSSGIYSVDTTEDVKIQSNIKNEDRRQKILSLVDERLNEEQKSMIAECLEKYSEVFDFETKSFSTTSNVKHKIDTSDSRPIKQRPYRVSPVERGAIQSEVDKKINMGIVQPSESSLVVFYNFDGSWIFCVNYRKLNKVTKKNVYPLLRNDDVLDSLTGAKFFSSMVLRTGYWQIEIDEEDQEKTAFIILDGLYQFRVMPFDYIFVYATFFKEHIERLGKVLRSIQQAGLCINHEKCRFESREIKVLEHLVTESGIRPDHDKIEAITNFPPPKTTTEPLHDLPRNNVKLFWYNEQEQSFQMLKSALTTDPMLGHFEEDAETLVHADASEYGVGAVLTQLVEIKQKPIAYASRTLDAAERNYSTMEKECLAVVWDIYKFWPYLLGKHFTVVSDHHSLCWLAYIPYLERWQ
ncbi:K02A2.6-like [Cordylochernes scorpioides]|uniref:K02A2.6-like n=1 Tax=Cordylochernes scorpioides TaxID=51811 RepID=A0ABY6L5T9_9ARAC|nr:K02A2.6-like [Cordylochernes scorpioides]